MSILQSILALASVKGATAAAARQALEPDLVHIMTSGNRRNIDDTAQALREAGAVTKDGKFSANVKGDILAALLASAEEAIKLQSVVRPSGMKGKATGEELGRARDHAEELGKAFLKSVEAAKEARAAARKAPAPKPEKPAAGEGKDHADGLPTAPDMVQPGVDALAAITAERDALAAQLAAITAERDALAAQLAALIGPQLSAAPVKSRKSRKPSPAWVAEALAA